jgi:uncharacterized membrane protein YkvA (DUF1232 family)
MTTSKDENTVRNEFWPKMAKAMVQLPFADEVIAAWYCAFDPATPLKVKGTLIGALAYFIMPFDVIPDVFLGLGFTDDIAVLITAFSLVKSHITEAHRERAKDAIEKMKAGETVSG